MSHKQKLEPNWIGKDFIMLPPKATFVVVATPDEENPEEYVSNTIPLLMVSGVDERTKLGSS